MKILMVNSVCGIKSTGRICTDLADILISKGHECRIAYGRETVPERYRDISYRIGSETGVRVNALKARVLDNEGFNAAAATQGLVEYIKEYAPDLIHLHNLHGYYLNIEILLNYIREAKIPVVFTAHDCWSVTGHCAYFSSVNCDRWTNGCHDCPQKKSYPSSLVCDRSKKNWEKKKELFSALEKMTVVTPSEWLAELLKGSFLSKHEVIAIPNGIDLEVFKPTESDIREKQGLQNKKMVLGVATAWDERKGLSELCRLGEALGEEYKVVLVGLSEKQISELPENILGLGRTDSVRELAGIYTAADVFVNAGKEETMGLTTVEAMACGTPVAVSSLTAVPEVVTADGGLVFAEYSVEAMAEAVREVVKKDFPSTRKNAEKYEKSLRYNEYLELYEKMISEKQ